MDAERRHELRRVACHGADIDVCGQHAVAGPDAGDLVPARLDTIDGGAKLEPHSSLGSDGRELLGEHLAIAGVVIGQAQRPDERHGGCGKAGFGSDAALRVEDLERHAVLLQYIDIAVDVVELLLGAEELQRPLLPPVIGDAGCGTQLDHLVARIFGDAHHARFVERVGTLGAVAEQPQPPDPHARIEHRADDQRAIGHQQPFDGLDRNAGACPRGGIAVGELAGIAETGLEAGAGLAVDDRHLMAGLGEIIRRRRTDNARAQDEHFHAARVLRFDQMVKDAADKSDQSAAAASCAQSATMSLTRSLCRRQRVLASSSLH